MTNQAYHHLKAACVKANNETAMAHLDALWRKEQDRRQRQRVRQAQERWNKLINKPTFPEYAY